MNIRLYSFAIMELLYPRNSFLVLFMKVKIDTEEINVTDSSIIITTFWRRFRTNRRNPYNSRLRNPNSL